MHKILLILGLLRRAPLYGYELNRIIRAHGELYSDLKKANLYYLLNRLAVEGDLQVHAEQGARGVRGEKLIYQVTDQGQAHFKELLREILLTYEPVHTGVGTGIVFLAQLTPSEGIALLEERRKIISDRRAQVVAELGDLATSGPLVRIAADHMVCLIDAELAWLDRSIATLTADSPSVTPENHADINNTNLI